MPVSRERLFHGDGTPVTFKYKKELGAALYYPDNEGYFIVIVSENTYGKGDTGAYFATFGYSRCHQFYFIFLSGVFVLTGFLLPCNIS